MERQLAKDAAAKANADAEEERLRKEKGLFKGFMKVNRRIQQARRGKGVTYLSAATGRP